MIYYVHKIKYRAVKKTVLMNRSFVTAWSEKAVIGMLIRLRKKQVISIYWGRLFLYCLHSLYLLLRVLLNNLNT